MQGIAGRKKPLSKKGRLITYSIGAVFAATMLWLFTTPWICSIEINFPALP